MRLRFEASTVSGPDRIAALDRGGGVSGRRQGWQQLGRDSSVHTPHARWHVRDDALLEAAAIGGDDL
jgi:hypothetical protein